MNHDLMPIDQLVHDWRSTEKETNPERFCSEPGCLHRTNGRPCSKHDLPRSWGAR